MKALRELGYTVERVEHWNHYAKKRYDFGGFADLIAYNDYETLAVQATTNSNRGKRVAKIAASERAARWARAPGRRIEVWGWRKLGGKWEPKIEEWP